MTRRFQFDRWDAELVSTHVVYFQMIAYLEDGQAVESHAGLRAPHVRTLITSMSPEDLRGRSLPEVVLDATQRSLAEAAAFYRRQMLVWSCTLLEGVLKDFCEAVFLTHPDRMYAFLEASHGAKGTVSFKHVLRCSSREELLQELCQRAVLRVLSARSFKGQLRSLASVARVELHDELSARLNALLEQRNRLIHDGSKEPVSTNQVSEGLGLCYELLHALAARAVEDGVEVVREGALTEFKLEVGAGTQLLGAKYDSMTRWPDNFDPEEAGAVGVHLGGSVSREESST